MTYTPNAREITPWMDISELIAMTFHILVSSAPPLSLSLSLSAPIHGNDDLQNAFSNQGRFLQPCRIKLRSLRSISICCLEISLRERERERWSNQPREFSRRLDLSFSRHRGLESRIYRDAGVRNELSRLSDSLGWEKSRVKWHKIAAMSWIWSKWDEWRIGDADRNTCEILVPGE